MMMNDFCIRMQHIHNSHLLNNTKFMMNVSRKNYRKALRMEGANLIVVTHDNKKHNCFSIGGQLINESCKQIKEHEIALAGFSKKFIAKRELTIRERVRPCYKERLCELNPKAITRADKKALWRKTKRDFNV